MSRDQSPQAFSVKRAQVEFHNFASLGEPELAMRVYREENRTRAGILQNHLQFIGPMSPFLEIGANAGHTSYMLANDFGATGFALDISADALRHGIALQHHWGLERAPVRVAGDAVQLPFRDGSLRLVLTFQTLSQFMDLDAILREVTRVLAPGGIFVFAEEPMRRLLSLRLYRCPYWETMKPWERKLFEWGLLGYLVRDVIGARQEDVFGIRQNHRMYLNDWDSLVKRHFVAREYDLFVPERGWGERWVKRLAIRLDPYGSVWRAARLLGGTLAGICRKGGEPVIPEASLAQFEALLRCPDCHSAGLDRSVETAELRCPGCGYRAPDEGGVYNLLSSNDRKELYPGDRDDAVDCSIPGHERRLRTGWHELEGPYGNKYRWIGPCAEAILKPVHLGPLRLRLRGFAPEPLFHAGAAPAVDVFVNGASAGRWSLDRRGLFVLETDVPEAESYLIEIRARPAWKAVGDDRLLTVNVSMLRLIPRQE